MRSPYRSSKYNMAHLIERYIPHIALETITIKTDSKEMTIIAGKEYLIYNVKYGSNPIRILHNPEMDWNFSLDAKFLGQPYIP